MRQRHFLPLNYPLKQMRRCLTKKRPWRWRWRWWASKVAQLQQQYPPSSCCMILPRLVYSRSIVSSLQTRCLARTPSSRRTAVTQSDSFLLSPVAAMIDVAVTRRAQTLTAKTTLNIAIATALSVKRGDEAG